MTAEMHVYEDHRKDTGPPWAVHERFCMYCGQLLKIVAKEDVEPLALCRMCDPSLYRFPHALEDGVHVVRIPAGVDC